MAPFLSLFLLGVLASLTTAAAPAPAEPPAGLDFPAVVLYYTNFYRQEKEASPLELDENLSVLADDHAKKLASAHSLKTNGKYTYAQNLYAYKGAPRLEYLNGRDAVGSWYNADLKVAGSLSLVDDKVLYDKDIKFIGVGFATDKDYTVVVAYYK